LRSPAGGGINLAALHLAEADGSTTLRLRVKPAARGDAIIGLYGTRLKITVAAPPERGKANQAVRRLLAEALGVPVSRVRVLSGEGAQDKVILVEGYPPDEVRRRLGGAARPSGRG